MRKLAAQGAKPCPDDIPSDLLEANCIPPNFMVQTGWDIVCDYYMVRSSSRFSISAIVVVVEGLVAEKL